MLPVFIFIHQAGSDINNNNNSNRQLNYKHLVKYYSLLQNWQKIHGRNIS